MPPIVKKFSITQIDDEPTLTGLITVSVAADILNVSSPTVRKKALKGLIRYVWICKGYTSEIMLFYKGDVDKLRDIEEARLEVELDQIKGN